jgi:hypothetical protein
VSRRNDLCNYLVNKVQALEADGTIYTQAYRKVTRDPIDGTINVWLQPGECTVGVYDIGEEKEREFGSTRVHLTVIIEFYYKPKLGQVNSEELNRILVELTKLIMTDYQQGGIAINTEEHSNQLDIDGIYDKIVNGSITFDITYRHGLFDPTKDLC